MAVPPFNVGQPLPMSIAFFDADHNPMSPTPVPDTPPSWTDTTPATGTLTVAADGLTASELGVAAGADTVNLAVIVGGQTFSATLDLVVQAKPQVLTSVEIVAGTPA